MNKHNLLNTINILILDDQEMWHETTRAYCETALSELKSEAQSIIKNSTIEFHFAFKIEEALSILSETKIHLMFVDKDLGEFENKSKINGIDFISKFKATQPFCQFVMLTANDSPIDVAKAFKNGASDYLLKGSQAEYAEYRKEVIRRTIERYCDEFMTASNEMGQSSKMYSNYVCQSPVMQRLDNKVAAIAESSRPVLYLGATGLGKGAIARRTSELRRIHLKQATRPFVQINFGAMDKTLAEARLFGTEPGAFTGALSKTVAGQFDLAKDGDLFLDEIGDAPLDLQLKILKVVEEKEFFRVGGKAPIKTNARLIFATNKDLQGLIKQGLFREDLYMRISTFEETIPSLEERRSDIPDIIRGFLAIALSEYPGKKIKFEDIPSDLMNHLTNTKIQGNIRGIENDVVRLVTHTPILSNGKPDFREWQKILKLRRVSGSSQELLTPEKLLNFKIDILDPNFPEREQWILALDQMFFKATSSNKFSATKAAKKLGISKNTVLSRMKELKFSKNESAHDQLSN